jgi:arabinogalactan oligomer/maltooligosaccharide transport system substrate-binding protein
MSVFGPDNDDYKNPGWDTPEAAKGLEYYLRMRQLFDVPSSEATWDNSVIRFQLGEIPLTITGPWAIGDAKANGVNFGTAKFPTIEGKQPACFSGVIVASVSSYSDNVEWANVFIDFLASDQGAGIMYEVKGTMTARADISKVPGLSDDPLLMGIAQQSPYSVPMPSIPEVDQMWGPGEDMIRFAWNGDLDIPGAQDKAMESYTTALAMVGKSID